MAKKDVLNELIKYSNRFHEMPVFNGKAALKQKIEGFIDFLNRYKTDKEIERLILKEGRMAYTCAVKMCREVKQSEAATKGPTKTSHSLAGGA